MDPLSDVLRVVRLTGAVFFTARTSAPWSVASPPADRLGALLDIRGECLALFHLVAEGGCEVVLDEHDPVAIEEGSIVVFPHGDSHVIGSAMRGPPAPILELLPDVLSRTGEGIPRVEYGGGGEAARFVCGYLRCDQRFNPLIGALPSLLVACPRRREVRSLPRPGTGRRPVEARENAGKEDEETHRLDLWLQTALQRTLAEVDAEDGAGTSAMLTRLTELLYLEVLRRYMHTLSDRETGWLAGVRHPQVGRALRLLHAEPARSWTVEALGREVGLSRSALAQRFADVVGTSPMAYLTGWRMQLAQHLLRQPELSVARVAARVGYASEPAFNRAFKRYVGTPPATWRAQSG